MRAISKLCAFLLLAALPNLARAVTIRVQDPNYSNITMPTSFYFGSCSGYLNNGRPVTSDGCFAGQNETGSSITSITLSFGTNADLEQAGGASAAAFPGDLFTAASTNRTPNPFTYTLNFTDGAITNNELFLVTEDGIDPALFPEVSLTFTNATPEPSSLFLLGTGLACMGGLYRRYTAA